MLAYGIIVPVNIGLTQLTKKSLTDDSLIEDYLLTLFEPSLDEEKLEKFNEDPLSFFMDNFNATILSKFDKNNFTCRIFDTDKLFLGYINPIPENFMCTADIKRIIGVQLNRWLKEKGFPNFRSSLYIKR